MSRRVPFAFESFGCDNGAEMGLLGGVPGHSLVMGVQVRVIVDLEICWGECFCDLDCLQ